MKSLITLFLATCCVPSLVLAGGIGGFVSYMDTSDLEDSTGAGVKLQLDLTETIALDLSGAWHSGLENSIAGRAVEMELIPIELGLVASVAVADNKLLPYIGAGGGYYQLGIDDNDPFSTDDIQVDDVFGWFGVLGLRVDVFSPFSLFAEARYRQIEGSLESRTFTRVDRADLDVDLSGVGFSGGVMLSW